MQLDGTVALITGAKRIGGVVAEELAKRGVSIGLAYARSRDEAERAAASVRACGARAATFQADLSDPQACKTFVDQAAAALGRVDFLINMASVYRSKPFADVTLADWDASLSVDLRATFLCSQAAVPHMKKQGGGRIVNFTDWLVKSGRPRYPGYVTYYVAKAGVMALTEALALELASSNILVNAIAPGPIVAPPDTTDAESKAVEQATPLGRWGGEIEIAKAVLALLDSDFITGETIRVDGGRHVK
jgi:NAD(P)-dependent dehydrogenase (short-subunit alcohol dehydrogenase family)